VPDIPLTRRQAVVVALVALVLLAVLGRALAGAGAAQAPRRSAAVVPASGASQRQRVVVHVVGAVRRPGLYRLIDGARVSDAVSHAGGPTRRADLSAVNLAAPLADGAQVIVPRQLPPGAAPQKGSAAAGGKVSLRTATIDQLDELPGVGPVTAQKIVDWRTAHGPFRTVDDLDQVPGIGPTRIEQLRELVVP
jgi:competence protein ComEA